MRLLTLAAFLLLPGVASANPWFNQAQAEQMVAQAMPEYYEHLSTSIAPTNPEKYQDKLHQALVMVVNMETFPELVDLWNRKWQAELLFRDRVADWKAAGSLEEQEALRAEMLEAAQEIQAVSLEIYQVKLYRGQERLDRLHLQIADLEMNEDMLAIERVMSALDEY